MEQVNEGNSASVERNPQDLEKLKAEIDIKYTQKCAVIGDAIFKFDLLQQQVQGENKKIQELMKELAEINVEAAKLKASQA